MATKQTKRHSKTPLLDALGTAIEEAETAALGEALRKRAAPDERELGESVIHKIVDAVGAPSHGRKGPRRRPPGRKRKATTNVTEENIRRLRTAIRQILGSSTDRISNERLPELLVAIIGNFNADCEAGLFLTAQECAVVSCIGYDARLREPVGFSACALAQIQKLAERTRSAPWISWEDFVSEAKWLLHDKAQPDDSEVFEQLQIVLRLKTYDPVEATTYELNKRISEIEGELKVKMALDDAFNKRVPKLSLKLKLNVFALEEHAMTPERRKEFNDLQLKVFHRKMYPGKSRPAVMKLALAQLRRIRLIIQESKFLEVHDGIEELYRETREINFYPSSEDETRPARDLETVFLNALRRQGIRPFRPIRNEELQCGPPRIPDEGDLDIPLY